MSNITHFQISNIKIMRNKTINMKNTFIRCFSTIKYWLYKDQANGNFIAQLIIELVGCIC